VDHILSTQISGEMHKKDVCSQWGDEGHISLVEASLVFPEAFFGQASTGLAGPRRSTHRSAGVQAGSAEVVSRRGPVIYCSLLIIMQISVSGANKSSNAAASDLRRPTCVMALSIKTPEAHDRF